MDSMTQIAFGALVGQAGWRKRFGRWALVAGAAGGLLPDLDVLIQTGDPFAGWLYHRGLSHSILFAPVLGLLLGFAFWSYFNRRYKKGDTDVILLAERDALGAWLWLGVLAVTTHIWLDLMTSYGTQILSPLSDQRFALNAMPIIDFVYTGILFVALAAGLSLKVPAKVAQSVAGVAILLSLAWQVFAWDINQKAENLAQGDFTTSQVQVTSYPILFTPKVRRVVVEETERIHVGFWRLGEENIVWRKFEKQTHPFIEKMKQTRAVKIFTWFTSGNIWWKVQEVEGSVRIEAHDLRYLFIFPNDPPQTPLSGNWGLRQDFNKLGEPLNEPHRWTNRSVGRVMDYYFGD